MGGSRRRSVRDACGFWRHPPEQDWSFPCKLFQIVPILAAVLEAFRLHRSDRARRPGCSGYVSLRILIGCVVCRIKSAQSKWWSAQAAGARWASPDVLLASSDREGGKHPAPRLQRPD